MSKVHEQLRLPAHKRPPIHKRSISHPSLERFWQGCRNRETNKAYYMPNIQPAEPDATVLFSRARQLICFQIPFYQSGHLVSFRIFCNTNETNQTISGRYI